MVYLKGELYFHVDTFFTYLIVICKYLQYDNSYNKLCQAYNIYLMYMYKFCHTSVNYFISTTTPPFNTFFPNVYITLTTY